MATITPDSNYSTLVQIQQKVRRLTRSLDESLLTTDQLNQYINTFVLYDFPEHLRLFNLHENFSFYTQAYVDKYYTDTTDTTDPLYNFQNIYLSINQPLYVAGYKVAYYQDQSQFYNLYPKIRNIQSIGTEGNGSDVTFTGYINTMQGNVQPFVENSGQGTIVNRGSVLFNSIDGDNNTLTLVDVPYTIDIGVLTIPNIPADFVNQPNGYINYLTGYFSITFPAAPGAGQQINSQVLLVATSRPFAILFYDGVFTIRPVPDQAYKVEMEVYKRPTELLNSTDMPKLAEWWQYIAYGCAKKIFEDRMDLDSVALILPEFKEQEALILRRTIVQNTTQRTASIYSEDTNPSGSYGNNGWFGGSGFF